MPVTENLSCWECDRCGGQHGRHADDKLYVVGDDWRQLGWERVSYQYDDGTTREIVLGPLCAKEYHEQRKTVDSEMRAFFNAFAEKKED